MPKEHPKVWPPAVFPQSNGWWQGPSCFQGSWTCVSMQRALAYRILKDMRCRPIWSLQDYIIIMDTHDVYISHSIGFFGGLFSSFCSSTFWNEEDHSMTVQKGCRDFKLLLKWCFSLCFYIFFIVLLCTTSFQTYFVMELFTVSNVLKIVIVFVMYIVSK